MPPMPANAATDAVAAARLWRLAALLALGSAVSLGLARFSYGLLLPPMRNDLGWSYALAGAMNTVNAAGYLIGALSTPWAMRRWGAGAVLVGGAVSTAVVMAASGLSGRSDALLACRLAAGVGSAWVFVSGGLLAARLGALRPGSGGLVLGIYYGGTGIGIVVSALVVPAALLAGAQWLQTWPYAWSWAWWILGAACALATLGLVAAVALMRALGVEVAPSNAGRGARAPLQPMGLALAGYGMFGVGYIGYMTFVIALLKDQGMAPGTVTVFYTVLGLAVMASSRIWSGLLDRHRDGQPLARLNGLLAAATVVPALSAHPVLVFASGALFGAVFLSVVASTTAFVRHNLPPAQWPAGISAFTIVFAAGQIVGPTLVGWISDGPGGLARGLAYSAAALALGAVLAVRQRALPAAATHPGAPA